MAYQIKETPILSGESSRKLNKAMAERAQKKVSPEEKERRERSLNIAKLIIAKSKQENAGQQ